MKDLTDVVSGAGLAGYAEIAMVIFLAIFVAIVWRVLTANTKTMDDAGRLPLDDGEPDADAPRPERRPDTPRRETHGER